MIKGKKVIIRQLELGDEEYFHKWWNDELMMEHSGNAFGTLQSKDSIRKCIVDQIEDCSMFPESKRFIILRKDDLVPIGEINYMNWDARNQKAEIGIKICYIKEQEKGYGYDALYYFIDFLFKFLNLNKIELTTMIDNIKAQGLYKRLGFKEVGIIREAYFDSRIGIFSSVVFMDLLKSDWKEIKSSSII
ncbi:GNAT family N-acetyltransferase [Clostridium sp. JNZ J1-5]